MKQSANSISKKQVNQLTTRTTTELLNKAATKHEWLRNQRTEYYQHNQSKE